MSSSETATCWLCWDDFKQGDAAQSLGCSCKGSLSTAHRSCLREWLAKHPATCATCRTPYDDELVSNILTPGSSGNLDLTGTISDAQQQHMRMQYVQKQQRWLLFLRHCAKCMQNEESCQYKRNCRIGKELWHHILTCTDPQCNFARCVGSRDLLKHHQNCRSNNCPICTPVKAYVRRGRQGRASPPLAAAGAPPALAAPAGAAVGGPHLHPLQAGEAEPQLEGERRWEDEGEDGEGSAQEGEEEAEEEEEEEGPVIKRARFLGLEGPAPPAAPVPHHPPAAHAAQQLANLPAELDAADLDAAMVADLDADMASEQQREHQYQLQRTMALLLHACSCNSDSCGSTSCRKVRSLFQHAVACQKKVSGGCELCRRMWGLLNLHAKHCTRDDCPVPRCKELKDIRRQQTAPQEEQQHAAYRQLFSNQQMAASSQPSEA